MNRYDYIIKEGSNKGRIVESVMANTKPQAFEKVKQSLTDAGLYREAAGFVFIKNFRVVTYKDV